MRRDAGPAEFRATVLRAAARYRPSRSGAYHFARGKLNGDPVFAAIFARGLIRDGARIVDMGCGQGVLPAILAAAGEQAEIAWPANWPAPPRAWTLTGCDLRARAVCIGSLALQSPPALARHVSLAVGDLRTADFPPCDVVAILDVLHYLEPNAQVYLLARVRRALAPAPGGVLLLRVADAAPTLRYALTLTADWFITLARGGGWPRFWSRPVDAWSALLQRLGFEVTFTSMHSGAPFANFLVVARIDVRTDWRGGRASSRKSSRESNRTATRAPSRRLVPRSI